MLIVSAPLTRSTSKNGTFSRAYSRFDSATAFRAQLVNRSSTQDSDTTVIDECDHVDGACHAKTTAIVCVMSVTGMRALLGVIEVALDF